MSIICFASLKGGVGKTSLAVNITNAFAERGCKTVLIDLDPSAHATRLFMGPKSVLIKENAETFITLLCNVRDRIDLVAPTGDLRYFLWGNGARSFRRLFPKLIEELREEYDHVIIDTAPDLNVITRNSIAISDIVTVPVDSSEMSIYCLEQLIEQTAHIKEPVWSIVQTMVNKQASRVRNLIDNRLHDSVNLEIYEDYNTSQEFISQLRSQAKLPQNGTKNTKRNQNPIFLLRSTISRTEEQNKLSFLHRTSFDSKATRKLSEQYLAVAKELEEILDFNASNSTSEPDFNLESYLPDCLSVG
jgi:cellulose biosynthesis protein BcsQ